MTRTDEVIAKKSEYRCGSENYNYFLETGKLDEYGFIEFLHDFVKKSKQNG